MIGLGTIINTALILGGGVCGFVFGKAISERMQETLNMACGISVLFLGIAGAMEGMLLIKDGKVSSTNSMFVVLCLVIGAFIGEILNIEDKFEKFAAWLKLKSGNAKDAKFIDGFVTASLTVCIGAMAVVGSITDGLTGDYSILVTKGILDFIIIMVYTSTYGKGSVFSAIPVFVLEGLITLLAVVIKPVVTDASMFNLSCIGSILIFCVGLNIVWGKKVRVANFLPALIIAVIWAFLPASIFA